MTTARVLQVNPTGSAAYVELWAVDVSAGAGDAAKLTLLNGSGKLDNSFINTGTSGATIPLCNTAVTWGGKATFPASATGAASINLPHGTAPTSPVDGDVWTTTTGVLARVNGATKTVGTLETSQTWGGIQTISSTLPVLRLYEIDQGVDLKQWSIEVSTSLFLVRELNDDGTVIASRMNMARGGSVIFNGGINSTAIGAITPSTGTFTTLSSSGNATLGDAATDAHTASGMLQVAKPSDFWSSSVSSFYTIGTESAPIGNITTQGNVRVAITSNGYRNNATQWTSYNAGGSTGAAQIELGFSGDIYFRTDAAKASGSGITITQRGIITDTGLNACAIGATTPSTVSATTVTATGLVLTPASATSGAGLRLPHGTAPTSPTNGDIWTTTTGLLARINGTTFDFQERDAQLTSLAALSFASNGGKYVRVNAGATDFELVTLAGGGDALVANPLSQFAATTSAQLLSVMSDETGTGALVFGTAPTLSNPIVGTQSQADNSTKAASTAYVDTGLGSKTTGPGSATDNAVARFDGTGGKTVQNSAATVDDDGEIRSTINSGACATVAPLTCFVQLTADYTLTNSAAEQKYFNTTANGTLTLPTGVYEFEWFAYLTTMSGTSGNAAFDPVGAGTAVTDRWGQLASGIDNTNPLNAGTHTGSASVTQQTTASVATAGTGTGLVTHVRGMFSVSTGGTLIPSITLVTAAAAVAKAGSWFRIRRIGASTENFVGAWT